MPTVRTESASIVTSAAAPAVRVKVIRTASSGAITKRARSSGTGAAIPEIVVGFHTVAGSAQPGTHYLSASGEISWAQGDMSPKYITVPLQSSGAQAITSNVDFTVTLQAPRGARFPAPHPRASMRTDSAAYRSIRRTRVTLQPVVGAGGTAGPLRL